MPRGAGNRATGDLSLTRDLSLKAEARETLRAH